MTEMCYPCPRTPVTLVPSLYSFKLGHPAKSFATGDPQSWLNEEYILPTSMRVLFWGRAFKFQNWPGNRVVFGIRWRANFET